MLLVCSGPQMMTKAETKQKCVLKHVQHQTKTTNGMANKQKTLNSNVNMCDLINHIMNNHGN